MRVLNSVSPLTGGWRLSCSESDTPCVRRLYGVLFFETAISDFSRLEVRQMAEQQGDVARIERFVTRATLRLIALGIVAHGGADGPVRLPVSRGTLDRLTGNSEKAGTSRSALTECSPGPTTAGFQAPIDINGRVCGLPWSGRFFGSSILH